MVIRLVEALEPLVGQVGNDRRVAARIDAIGGVGEGGLPA